MLHMSEELRPNELTSLRDVGRYWRRCLDARDDVDEKLAASHIVGVVANIKDEQWSAGENAHPAYGIIFELAASLETPNGTPEFRQKQWACIEALLPLLEAEPSET